MVIPVLSLDGSHAMTRGGDCARQWDATHPALSQAWRGNWERVTLFFAFPTERFVR